MAAHEVNFDGLVGPTHNYAGLSAGNVASIRHGGRSSNPRAAALQGLAKMKFLADLGAKQAFLPPHPRPDVATLRAFGFGGTEAQVLAAAARHAPRLLAAAWSASNMWLANAATVAPSSDTADGRVHLVVANLVSNLHRAIEASRTADVFRAILHDASRFVVHDPLPGGLGMADEGAANHTRLAPTHGDGGLHLFVHGRDGTKRGPRVFPARQTLAASQAVARLLQLDDDCVCFARQNPAAIDAGVFHNDVIAVGNENVLLHHELAWEDGPKVVRDLRRRFTRLHRDADLITIKVSSRRVPLREAVATYLFNSQLVTVAPGRMVLIAPTECQRSRRVGRFLEQLIRSGDTPIRDVHFFDLRQSMRNGGGPACLRLRVVLNDKELAALPAAVFIDERRHEQLVAWVRANYPDKVTPRDLVDPRLATASQQISKNVPDLHL